MIDSSAAVSQDQVGNLAAFLRISDDGSLDYTTYSAQPHPTDIRRKLLRFPVQNSSDDVVSSTAMMYAGGYSSMMM